MANKKKPQGEVIKTSGVGLPEQTWENVETEVQRQGYPSRNAYIRDAVAMALRMKNLRVQVAEWHVSEGEQ